MSWYITNDPKINGVNTSFKTSITPIFYATENVGVFIDGYIIPRLKIQNQYNQTNQADLVLELYKKHGLKFIHYIKGIFIVILFFEDRFIVFNDRHNLKKYFVFEKDSVFYISDSLKLITTNYSVDIDKENAALFTLFSHFIDGLTLFKNITACNPAHRLEYIGNKIKSEPYWSPKELITIKKIVKKNIADISNEWLKTINGYIDFLRPKDISITVTGGNDSRLVLSALLKLKKPVHSFTFGNPNSYDGYISNLLTKKVELNHSYYFRDNPSENWFRENAKEIVGYGNSLINIHRAHRNDAIKQEVKKTPDLEMIFTGLVGGEYLKEPRYDDVVIPVLFYQIQKLNKKKGIALIESLLTKKGVNINNINIEVVYQKTKNFLKHGTGFNNKEKKFIYTYLFYGCAHHTQDTNVFGQFVKYVVNPFMDIDFLELISQDNNWYINKKKSILDRLFHSKLIIAVTDILAPQLSDIPYAKRGKYTANDLLRNKFKYLYNRMSFLFVKEQDKYPANFPMGSWLFEYSKNELEVFSTELSELFNIPYLNSQLNNLRNVTIENKWHIITNPINLNLNYVQYKKV